MPHRSPLPKVTNQQSKSAKRRPNHFQNPTCVLLSAGGLLSEEKKRRELYPHRERDIDALERVGGERVGVRKLNSRFQVISQIMEIQVLQRLLELLAFHIRVSFLCDSREIREGSERDNTKGVR